MKKAWRYLRETFSVAPPISEHAMITVYNFRRWNFNDDVYEYPILKSTAARIARIDGEILPDTAELVSPKTLDHQERYIEPRARL